MNNNVLEIPLEAIRVVNPRLRDKQKFALIVESIRNLGLKKPIQVSLRDSEGAGPLGYDLICGQGRMEAFQMLGYTAIPAVVVEASKEDRLLMSLVENIARRYPSRLELIDEMLRLSNAGYSNASISRKLDVDQCTVGDFLRLGKSGEGRLLKEVLSGKISVTVAIEISKVEGMDQQKAFMEAFEKKQLNQASVRAVRRILVQRELFGKKPSRGGVSACRSSDSLVNALKKESSRQRLLIQKTRLCEARILFIVEAFKRITGDEDFMNLLRAEKFDTMPKELADLISTP